MWIATKDNEFVMGSIVLEFQQVSQEVDSSLVDLLAYDDEQFVHRAYRALLGREPDPEGLGNYLERLRDGIPKLQLASDLRMSDEGVRWAIRMPGLATGYSALENIKEPESRRITTLQQLLLLSDRPFVEFAIEKLLGHPPDINQSAFYLEQIRSGNSKVGILAQLFSTREARSRRANLNEWDMALAKHGNDANVVTESIENAALSRDSSVVVSTVPSLTELLTLHAEGFVAIVFQSILGRKPDVRALDFYVKRLADGVSKLEVLGEVTRSQEARAERDFMGEIANAVRIYRLAQLPWFGWIIRLVMRLEGESETERRLRRIESQVFLLGNNSRLNLNRNLAESKAAYSFNTLRASADHKISGEGSQDGGDVVARPFRAAASMLRTLPPINEGKHEKKDG